MAATRAFSATWPAWAALLLWTTAGGLAAGEAATPGAPAVTVQTLPSPTGELRFQTTLDKKFVTKAYTLKAAKAAELEPLVRQLVVAEAGTVKVVNLGDVQLLIVSVPTYMVADLDATVAALDQKNASVQLHGQDCLYYKPRNRLASDLMALARDTNASLSVIAGADDASNTIYFQDTPATMVDIKDALSNFDVPQPQVEIEVKIVEVNKDDNKRVGLLWDAWKRALPDSAESTCTRERAESDADGDSRFRSCQVTLSNMSPQALADFVNYMVRHDAAEVKTSTRLNCLQGQAATLTAGDVHRFLTAAQPQLDGGAPAKNVVDTAVAGLVVTLTPFIGAETIKLEVSAEVSSLSGFDPNGMPVVNSRTVAAAAVLKDGQVFALTGLERETDVQHEDRVWGLGHIPWLGKALFTTHSTARITSQLVVVLTPRMAAPGGPGVAVAESLQEHAAAPAR